MSKQTPIARLDSVGLVLDGRAIVKNVTLEVFPGEVLALVGPNGAGKSSILSLLSGDVQATSGTAFLESKDVTKYRTDASARLRSVLLQSNQVSFPFSVWEIVEMGRAPWARTPQISEDDEAIEEALRLADVGHLSERRLINSPVVSGHGCPLRAYSLNGQRLSCWMSPLLRWISNIKSR